MRCPKVRVVSNTASPYLKPRSRNGTRTSRSGTIWPLKYATRSPAAWPLTILLPLGVPWSRATGLPSPAARVAEGRRPVNAGVGRAAGASVAVAERIRRGAAADAPVPAARRTPWGGARPAIGRARDGGSRRAGRAPGPVAPGGAPPTMASAPGRRRYSAGRPRSRRRPAARSRTRPALPVSGWRKPSRVAWRHRRRSGIPARAVAAVADDRVAELGQLDADLVAPARAEPERRRASRPRAARARGSG